MIVRWSTLVFLLARVSTITFPPLNLYIGTVSFDYEAGSLPLGALRLNAATSGAFDIPIRFQHYAGYQYTDMHTFNEAVIKFNTAIVHSLSSPTTWN
ncbi:unnamed protein product [Rotaria sp. Silwood1]|nr:unnamed protein product [Rotaria sp. Silwood1]